MKAVSWPDARAALMLLFLLGAGGDNGRTVGPGSMHAAHMRRQRGVGLGTIRR